jgi:hypothetical protein
MTRSHGDGTDEGFAKGGHVRWNPPQGETTGSVVEKLTSETEIKGHDAKSLFRGAPIFRAERQDRRRGGP